MVPGFWLTRSHVSKRPVEAAAKPQGCSQSKVPQLCSTTCPWENHQLEEAGPRQFTHVQTHSKYSRVFKCNSCSILFLSNVAYISSYIIIYDHILSYYIVLSYESYLNFHVFARGTEGTSVSGLELSEGSNLLSPVFGMMPKRDALEKAATDKQHLLTWEVLFRCCLQMVLQSKIKDLRGKDERLATSSGPFATIRHVSFDHSSCQSQDWLLGKPAPGVSACCRRWRGGMVFSLFAMTNGR